VTSCSQVAACILSKGDRDRCDKALDALEASVAAVIQAEESEGGGLTYDVGDARLLLEDCDGFYVEHVLLEKLEDSGVGRFSTEQLENIIMLSCSVAPDAPPTVCAPPDVRWRRTTTPDPTRVEDVLVPLPCHSSARVTSNC